MLQKAKEFNIPCQNCMEAKELQQAFSKNQHNYKEILFGSDSSFQHKGRMTRISIKKDWWSRTFEIYGTWFKTMGCWQTYIQVRQKTPLLSIYTTCKSLRVSKTFSLVINIMHCTLVVCYALYGIERLDIRIFGSYS